MLQGTHDDALWLRIRHMSAMLLTARLPMQIVIQLQKFAEAVKRIKGAVGSVNDKKAAPAAAKPSGKSAYSSNTVFGRDISSILSTDLTDIDPSVGGQPAHSPTGTIASTGRGSTWGTNALGVSFSAHSVLALGAGFLGLARAPRPEVLEPKGSCALQASSRGLRCCW